MAKQDAFGAALRGEAVSGSAGGASGNEDISATVDQYLDACYAGLAGLGAALEVLSSETGNAPEDALPTDASAAFRDAQSAVFALRDAVDAELMAAGLEPTTS
jgi:hypothetical protein